MKPIPVALWQMHDRCISRCSRIKHAVVRKQKCIWVIRRNCYRHSGTHTTAWEYSRYRLWTRMLVAHWIIWSQSSWHLYQSGTIVHLESFKDQDKWKSNVDRLELEAVCGWHPQSFLQNVCVQRSITMWTELHHMKSWFHLCSLFIVSLWRMALITMILESTCKSSSC